MQVAIDNAKRQFDIDLTNEIKRIKEDMDIGEHGYPEFWKLIKRNFKGKVNKKLHCPMNCLCDLEFENYRNSNKTIPMSYFFQKFDLDMNRKTCKRVEEFIEKYSLGLFNYNTNVNGNNSNEEGYILLRSDFDDLINEIQKINISKNYLGLMSWLIDRAFLITPQTRGKSSKMQSTIGKNKSVLLKTLYEVNKKNLLKCLSGGINEM